MKFSIKYSDKDMKRLQEGASKCYPELKDDQKFQDWVAEYISDSVYELCEEHIEDYDVEDMEGYENE